jgi:hypothetical protein
VWHKDRARQQVLERANWTFERIRGSAFYRDPDTALIPLWQRLSSLGIPTGDWWSDQVPPPTLREVSGAGHPQREESELADPAVSGQAGQGEAGTAVSTSVT